ncbi:fimbrial protein [Pantoea sp. Taur]|uniref:fimbrial protein n=1 Tax=Pantoea sp. Taur TaxID=2576757 RepID=UPI0013697E3F|nr:fimbrial protein [Pantoea sp. Taur]
MKKTLLVLSLLATATTQADTGKIVFTGKLQDTTCTVTASHTAVNMGAVKTAVLGAAGNTANPQEITFDFAACGALTKARVAFDGVRDTADTGLHKNTATTPAANVALGIYEADGVTPVPYSVSAKDITLSTTGSAKYIAKMVATGEAEAGNFESNVTYHISYL